MSCHRHVTRNICLNLNFISSSMMMAVANKTAIALDKAISNRKKYLNTFNNLKNRNEKGLFTLFFIFRH